MSSTLAHRKTSMVSKRVAAKARKKSKKKTRKTKMDLDSAKMSGSESDDFESLNIEFDDDEPYYYMSMLDMSRRKKYLHQHVCAPATQIFRVRHQDQDNRHEG